jgi:hypothetical protein
MTVEPRSARAQITAERVVTFSVPEANGLGHSISVYENTVLLGTIYPEAYAFQFGGGR